MKTTDREVASCRKVAPKPKSGGGLVWGRCRAVNTPSGNTFVYLNMDGEWVQEYPERHEAQCKRCGYGYSSLIGSGDCVCEECRGEDLEMWGWDFQRRSGIFFGWTLHQSDDTESETSSRLKILYGRADRWTSLGKPEGGYRTTRDRKSRRDKRLEQLNDSRTEEDDFKSDDLPPATASWEMSQDSDHPCV